MLPLPAALKPVHTTSTQRGCGRRQRGCVVRIPEMYLYGHFNEPGDEEVEIYYLVR